MSKADDERTRGALVLAGQPWRVIGGEQLREAACQAVLSCASDLVGRTFHVRVDAVRGRHLLTPGSDEAWIAEGVVQAYDDLVATSDAVGPSARGDGPNRRPPSEITIRAGGLDDDPHEYAVTVGLVVDDGLRGHLFQETKATLNPVAWENFLRRVMPSVLVDGPEMRRLSVVAGGTSAEQCLATAAKADAGLLDELPSVADGSGRALRDKALEAELIGLVLELTGVRLESARVVRQVRHGGSLPVAFHVGLRSDRRVTVKI